MEEGQNIKDYKIIKTIGRGGCGIVYLVQKGNKNEQYALKKIPILSENEIEEYKKILNAIFKINNEHVIKYFEYFIENKSLYILMEYGGDSDLKKFINSYKDKDQLIEEKNKIKDKINNINKINNEYVIKYYDIFEEDNKFNV